jgi:hypothetical protein
MYEYIKRSKSVFGSHESRTPAAEYEVTIASKACIARDKSSYSAVEEANDNAVYRKKLHHRANQTHSRRIYLI